MAYSHKYGEAEVQQLFFAISHTLTYITAVQSLCCQMAKQTFVCKCDKEILLSHQKNPIQQRCRTTNPSSTCCPKLRNHFSLGLAFQRKQYTRKPRIQLSSKKCLNQNSPYISAPFTMLTINVIPLQQTCWAATSKLNFPQIVAKHKFTECPIKFWMKILQFVTFVLMGHDVARLCTAQHRAVPCRAITHSKQNKTIFPRSPRFHIMSI